MISQKLQNELAQILKEEFNLTLTEKELFLVSHKLLHFGQILTNPKYQKQINGGKND